MSLASCALVTALAGCQTGDGDDGARSESMNTEARDACATAADGATNVRAAPRTQAEIVTTVPPTTAVTVTKFPASELTAEDRDGGRPTSACKGNWAHVSDAAFSGWIRSDRLACGDVCASKDRTETATTPSRRVRLDYTKVFDTESAFEIGWVAKNAAGAELGRGACADVSGDPIVTPREWEWGWAECRGVAAFAGATYTFSAHGTALTSLSLTPL